MTTASGPAGRPAVLAVDGGNSKTDVVLLARDGHVLGSARGPGSNHTHSDLPTVMALVDSLVQRATGGIAGTQGGPTAAVAQVAVLCLAGADYPVDERRLAAAAAPFGWAERVMVSNDTFAMLRSGTDDEVGVALVCGAGVNCVGKGPGGRTARFDALGEISGDWGGGYDIGIAALGAAIRATDGRGPRTALADLVPRYFGMARPAALVYAIYAGRIEQARVVELPALVFAAADDGDEVAISIVDRQGTELVAMATAMLRRLRLTRVEVDVVLGGGILTSGHPRLLGQVTAGILAVAPRARMVALSTAPVAGAALLGLDELHVVPKQDVRAAVAVAFGSKEKR